MCKKTVFTIFVICWGLLFATSINNLWVLDYDYHKPEYSISPIGLAMGGINITNAEDYLGIHDNPALLANNTINIAATSFILKNNEPLTFAELMNARTLLKDKQFLYFTIVSKKTGIAYQPVSAVHISTWNEDNTRSEYYDYQLDKIQMSFAATDENYSNFAGGLNIKYLTGRLVYLRERRQNNNLIREAFIDDKVKGISGDLGFTLTEGQFIWGACVHDLFSKMWWENYDSKSLKRRAAMGFQYNMEKMFLTAAVQGKVSSNPETTYHFGLVKNWVWKTGSKAEENETEQKIVVRMGLFSKDFNGTKNIHYTLGSGYNYNLFRIDFALTNSGMKLKDSQYLFSLGAGIP